MVWRLGGPPIAIQTDCKLSATEDSESPENQTAEDNLKQETVETHQAKLQLAQK